MQPQPVRLNPLSVMPERYYSDLPQIVFRIGDRLSEEVFLHHFIPWTEELKAGNIYVNSVQSYTDLRKQSEFSAGTTDTYRKNITLGLFFLINLCLGWPERSGCKPVHGGRKSALCFHSEPGRKTLFACCWVKDGY